IPLLILTPAQYGIFIHTPNLSHGAGPLVLLLGFCLAFTVASPAVRYPLLVALDFLLLHTGFGILAGVLAPPLVALCALSGARARRAGGAADGAMRRADAREPRDLLHRLRPARSRPGPGRASPARGLRALRRTDVRERARAQGRRPARADRRRARRGRRARG